MFMAGTGLPTAAAIVATTRCTQGGGRAFARDEKFFERAVHAGGRIGLETDALVAWCVATPRNEVPHARSVRHP